MDTPDKITTGCPSDRTWVAPMTHSAVTHGPMPAGGAKAHPATVYGAAMVVMGIPETKTQVLGTVGMAWPPCAHVTTAPWWRIGPGMAISF
jgi:hypothetical protein